MDSRQELSLHVDALLSAMESNKEFFAPVMHYVKALKHLLTVPGPEVSKSSLRIPAGQIKAFWDDYKSSTPGSGYFPPVETANTQRTVDEIDTLITKLVALPDDQFAASLSSGQSKTVPILIPIPTESDDERKPQTKRLKDFELHPQPESAPLEESALDRIFLILRRFHTVARELLRRREDRETIKLEDEYDVQDLLRALLKIFFDDVRLEEWTPSYAGKSSKVDFFLKPERIVLEVKTTMRGLDAREIGDQLIVDIERYRQMAGCHHLICFVYDPEHRITNPVGFEQDLSRSAGGLIAQVIVLPKSF